MKFFKILRRGALAVAALALFTTTQAWAGIVNNLPTIRINGQILYYYDTQSGDNIYTIAEKLGVSVEDIRSSNPSVSDGIKPRMRLFFPTDIKSTAKGNSAGPLTHVVAKGESIYGIAHKYGITMDELIAMNPLAKDGIKTGMRLTISPDEDGASTEAIENNNITEDITEDITETTTPQLPEQEQIIDEPVAEELPLHQEIAPTPLEDELLTDDTNSDATNNTTISTPVIEEEVEEMNVAIILPFLLKEEKIGRQTQLYTEFYKGFLLAADSLNLPGHTPIRLHAYDSAANLDSVKAIMQRPEMASMDMIVAPDNIAQLHAIAENMPETANILNVFAVKDSSYQTIPGMIQTNIPHTKMYSHAIEGFLETYPEATPVFVSRQGGRTDKEIFTDELKAKLSSIGRVYKTIHYDNYLADANLEELSPETESYVFIPVSGNRDEFNRILHAIKALKERATDPSYIQVFGYPEWATFRGEQFDEICDLETTIYSRYFPVEHDADAEQVNEAFKNAYGVGVIDKQMPVLGILGFDTGRMVIEGLRTKAGHGNFPTEFSGIQTGIKLEQDNEYGGLFNNALFIITYRPGGIIEKKLK